VLETLVHLLPFVIAGAFLPTWTSYVILLLGTDRPIVNASAYVAGNATWRMLLGFVAIFVVSLAAPETQEQGIVLPPWFAWSLAGILFAMGIWLVMRKPAAAAGGDSTPRWLKAFRRLPPWAVFGYAVYNCALPGVQWVYFLGGTAVIASSGYGWELQLVMLAVFVALLQIMLVTPIVIYARRRDRAKASFERLELWLARHATTVFGAILIMIAALFADIALQGGQVGGAA
jgi:hypothetical protein